ncbi:DUF5684 domain-containing protein [Actinosynnema sp. NPDC053489]|uniref:DUF5684 domain-containing protein n=1 Tax=Actinosynnema sp. NPDC053489 TaxID=3363916 RepID=UPI0037C6674F
MEYSDNPAGFVPGIVALATTALVIVALWRVFTKAGKPGWAAITPICNPSVRLEIAGRPAWWPILHTIPLVDIIVSPVVSIDLARSFGKGAGFDVVGPWLFGIVGYPVLAFGDATHRGPVAA